MSGPIDEVVPPALDGERVDRVVALVAGISRSDAARVVDGGGVALDGRVVTVRSARVESGQTLTISSRPEPDPAPEADATVAVTLVAVDDDVIVVDKPPGLVVHPGAGNRHGTLVNGLLARFPEIADIGQPHRPGIVHRLDRGTSGLLVVARTRTAYEDLVSQLAEHRVSRVYQALVWGSVDDDRGTIDAPVGRSQRHPTRMTITERGRRAVTHYEVLERYHVPVVATLLRCRLETGRTHQIRVHTGAIGHPVVGDRDYGGARPGLDVARPFLHAELLAFDHPADGRRVELRSPLPDDLSRALAELEAGPAAGP